MRTTTRSVYYCDFCKRHRLTARAILQHEPRCIYNPQRHVCGWHRDRPAATPESLLPRFLETLDHDWLRETVDGCPACMLAVVVQAKFTQAEFNYRAEVERFREEEREHERWQEIRLIEGTFL